MRAFILALVVGITSLGSLAVAPPTVKAREWQAGGDTVAVSWRGGSHWRGGWGGGAYWRGGSRFNYPYYGSYYAPSYYYSPYDNYYSPGYNNYFSPGYNNYYSPGYNYVVPGYRYYRPRLQVYWGW